MINPHRFTCSTTLAAVVGDTTAVPNNCRAEESSVFNASHPVQTQDETGKCDGKKDEEDGTEGLDDHKMIRVCDKLIEVFLVDKPTPTDWRRLLAFSKEWDNMRPHFFRRCQDRADSEDNPGMKHKLLRLGRKLKEVGCAIYQLTFLRVILSPSDIVRSDFRVSNILYVSSRYMGR